MSGRAEFLFLDIETTGLDPMTHAIIELGAIAVDRDLREVDRFHSFVGLNKIADEEMSDFSREIHGNSGLLEACRAMRGLTIKDVQESLETFLAKHFTSPIVMCGHSIHFDREFLQYDMPKAMRAFSHRIRDTGSIARFMRENGAPVPPEPTEELKPHRSIPDCEWELEEARHCARLISRLKGQPYSGFTYPEPSL